MRLDIHIKYLAAITLAFCWSGIARETSSMEMSRHEFVNDESVHTFNDYENDAIVMKMNKMEV